MRLLINDITFYWSHQTTLFLIIIVLNSEIPDENNTSTHDSANKSPPIRESKQNSKALSQMEP